MRPRWYKVLRDLFYNRTRTALVVLSIAVGVWAFGTVLAAQIVFSRALHESYLSINPASATITTNAFEDTLVDAVRHVPGVGQVQGRRAVTARIQTGPETWQDTVLYVLPTDGVTEVGVVKPWAGAWPPPKNTVLIERASMAKAHATLGGPITIALTGKDPRTMPVAGTTYDLSLPPAIIAGQVFGYISFDTLEWLGGPRGYNQIVFVVSENRGDEQHIHAVAADVERLIKRGGREIINTDVPTPLQHPIEAILPPMLGMMTMIGFLTVLISIFLIINTIGAILTQQTRQIGIMKAIGARSKQIAGLYFVLSAAFGVLALVFAIPLSIASAYALTAFLCSQMNVDMFGFSMPLSVLATEVATALLVPMIAASFPIRSVARRPAREALAGDSSAPTEHTPIDRFLERLRGLTRPTRLALRNTFRRKGRLARTLIALSLGGAVFISSMTLGSSLFTTLDASIASQRYDVEIQFSRTYRDAQVMPSIMKVPEVTSVESLLRDVVFPVHDDGSTGEMMNLRAMPAGTVMFSPRMAAGRWLVPSDEHGVVLSTNINIKEPGLQVGDEITLQIGGENYRWQIVGLIDELMPPTNPTWVYVTLDAYTNAVGKAGRTDTMRVATVNHDAASQKATAEALERQLKADGYEVRLIHNRSEDRAILAERFSMVSVIMVLLALIIGIVGGLSLAGTMSINVLERTREIGIMRAIGAKDSAIRQIVLSESVATATLAWLIGTIISFPMSYAMDYGIGMGMLNAPMIWVYSWFSVALWLGFSLLVAVVASLLPARAAVRLTVREVLSYE